MDVFLLILGAFLIILGLIGCFLPVLPGPPLAFAGMVVAHFGSGAPFSIGTLIIFGALTIIVSILEYVIQIIGTKFTGGTKYGNIGAAVGLIIGFFIYPIIGLILGPFLGALIGEIIGGKKFNQAFKIALGSFIGFLTGTFLKVALCLAMLVSYILALFT